MVAYLIIYFLFQQIGAYVLTNWKGRGNFLFQQIGAYVLTNWKGRGNELDAQYNH